MICIFYFLSKYNSYLFIRLLFFYRTLNKKKCKGMLFIIDKSAHLVY